jgi:hypothetical protein
VVFHFSQIYALQLDALPAGCAVSLPQNNSLFLLLAEDLGWAASHEVISTLLMVEVGSESDVGHETIETSGDWRPLCMFLSDTLLSIDLKVNLLVLSEFGDQNILKDKLCFLKFDQLIALGNPLELI